MGLQNISDTQFTLVSKIIGKVFDPFCAKPKETIFSFLVFAVRGLSSRDARCLRDAGNFRGTQVIETSIQCKTRSKNCIYSFWYREIRCTLATSFVCFVSFSFGFVFEEESFLLWIKSVSKTRAVGLWKLNV